MLRILPLILLGLCSCQYEVGEPQLLLKGNYTIGSINNISRYHLFEKRLHHSMSKVLRRYKETAPGKKYEATHTLSGTIISVRKYDRERERETGRITEAQLIITFEATLKTPTGSYAFTVHNTDRRYSSGTYRLENKASIRSQENKARFEALDDLAEAVFSVLSKTDFHKSKIEPKST